MNSIIVGTDFSKGSLIALELAIDIANKLHCDIKIVWAKREKLLIDEEQQTVMSLLAEDKLTQLCEKNQPLMKYGKIRWDICSGRVAAVIARVARHENSPMIVIGTNGASGFEKYWMGSTAVRIVQEAPVPVLTIREGFNFHKDLERIVVPIRINVNSRQKVPPAATMAKMFGSEIHILGLQEFPEEQKYSNYSDTVLTYCENIKADLVVINTEQDRIISQLFLGTNAQQIVHNSQIPVLCVHPADIITLSKS